MAFIRLAPEVGTWHAGGYPIFGTYIERTNEFSNCRLLDGPAEVCCDVTIEAYRARGRRSGSGHTGRSSPEPIPLASAGRHMHSGRTRHGICRLMVVGITQRASQAQNPLSSHAGP